MENQHNQQSISERFNGFDWHDSKLYDLHLVLREGQRTCDLLMNVGVVTRKAGHQQLLPAQLVIRECTIVRFDLDLETKAVCGHDISDATCMLESDYIETLEQTQLRNENRPLAGFLHFAFVLCPPSGEIDVIARSFDLGFTDRGHASVSTIGAEE